MSQLNISDGVLLAAPPTETGVFFTHQVARSRINIALSSDVVTGEFDAFVWRGRVIRFGKRRLDNGNVIYRFQNLEVTSSEEQNAMRRYLEGRTTREEYLLEKGRMGHMVVISNLDRDPEWIYNLYKHRDSVEKDFRRMFEVLGADPLGVSDTPTAAGMVFVLTLAVRLRVRLRNVIRRAGLSSGCSVDDALLAYSKAYAVERESGTVDYEIPARLEKLDSALGLNIFPILRN